MSFYIYQNIPNKKVTIHRGDCPHCNNGHGVQQNSLGDANGQWHMGPDNGYPLYQHASVSAEGIAQGMGIIYRNCQRCNPNL